jgi:NCAIR mutase (PurE)-related protein
LKDILRQVETGKLGADDAASMILRQPAASPDDTLQSFANLDHSRANRTGFPEAVFAQSKTPAQVAAILDDMALNVNNNLKDSSGIHKSTAGTAILATRVTPEQYKEVSKIPLRNGTIAYHDVAQIISMKASGLEASATPRASLMGEQTKVVVCCAGTTDLPVAEEAAITLEAAGCEVTRVYDAGVAGLHRIINALPKLRDPQVGCVIVCAGMDGALPSVVGGLVDVPVIAVPTSIGYGASFNGISAMLTMLNSCAPGVGVVNIDNGFGAAALAFKCVNRK